MRETFCPDYRNLVNAASNRSAQRLPLYEHNVSFKKIGEIMGKDLESLYQGDERDVEELLEACEYAANLLEAGELVPMAYPPTAKIEAYRRQKHVDAMEIADYLTELIGTLKKACHII